MRERVGASGMETVKRDGRKEGSGCSDAMAWHYRRSLQSSSRLGRRPYGQQQDCVIWR